MLLTLEDDAQRIERFRAALKSIDAACPLVIWRSVPKMLREVDAFLPSCRLISLDHDLEPQPGDDEEPGDRIDVARYLAERPAVCPVVIHSSNGTRSDWMMGEFELGGWDHHRVAPIGDDWIEAHWRSVVRKLLKRTRRPAS